MEEIVKRDPSAICQKCGTAPLFITIKSEAEIEFIYNCIYCMRHSSATTKDGLTPEAAQELAKDKFLYPGKYKPPKRSKRKKAADLEDLDELEELEDLDE